MPEPIRLPHNYEPREYQLPFWQAFDSGFKRLVWVAHRRAGKDKTFINLAVRESQRRVGAYYYFFPTYAQAKKVIWEGMDKDGFAFMDHFPEGIVESVNNTEMKVKLANGSIFQIIGTDNIDAVMGTNPVGCLFSEYSLQDPRGWDYIRPILSENGGWAVFNGTPRGKNHLYAIYRMAIDNPEWWCERLTVDDTGAISMRAIESDRAAGMAEETIQQEYWCSFEGNLQGSFFGDLITEAEIDGRITRVPHDPAVPVDTWWDIGFGDRTSIWFVQEQPWGPDIIDFTEAQGKAMPDYLRMLQHRPYVYGTMLLPHDADHHEWGTGHTPKEQAAKFGYRFKVCQKLAFMTQIQTARAMFPLIRIDERNCADGLEALKAYRREELPSKYWHSSTPEYKDVEFHDWSSHAGSAFRTGAIGRRRARPRAPTDRYAGAGQRYRLRQRSTGWMAA